ncbi:MAG: hypothetical protein NVSMB46_08880 [Candidatus Saccharimonadales bacterium]
MQNDPYEHPNIESDSIVQNNNQDYKSLPKVQKVFQSQQASFSQSDLTIEDQYLANQSELSPINVNDDNLQSKINVSSWANPSNSKSVKKWVLLLVIPIVLFLFIVAIESIFLLTNKANRLVGFGFADPFTKNIGINLLILIAGVLCAGMFLISPLWMFFIIRDLKGHERKKKIAVQTAVIFGLFSWLYTFEKNKTKFWINLGLLILTIGYWSPISWLWAVIDNVIKPDDYYNQYIDD